MRIVCLITVGSFFITVTTAESDISIGDDAKRIPRALILKPVIKKDDEGPFDFLANWISRMINPSPKKPPSSHLSMLGSLRVPGINDLVFLENLNIPSRSSNRLVFRVMPETLKTPSFSGMPFTDQSNSFSPFFPITSTRLPITTNNFNKILSTAPTWPRYPPPYFNSQHNNRPNDYFNNNYNNQPVNFYKEFSPHQPYKKPLSQYPSNPTSSPSEPFLPYVPQTSYGNYDNHNLISGGNNNFNYGSNYLPSLYPSPSYNPHDLHNYNHNFGISNQSEANIHKQIINNDNNNKNEIKETLETVDLNRVTPITTHNNNNNINDNITPTINPSTRTKITSSPASINDNEIYRSDRMIPTINPNYKDTRYWRPFKTTSAITSSSTLRPTSLSSLSSLSSITTSSSTNRYSARDIQEIPPPNLKNSKQDIYRENSTKIIYINDNDDNNKEWIIAEKSSESKMDEKDEDGITLGQSDSQEYNGNKNINKNQDYDPKLNVIRILKKNINNSRGNSREWKPPTTMKTTTTTINSRRFISNNNNNSNNYTVSTIDNVMDLTANNDWRDDIKKIKER